MRQKLAGFDESLGSLSSFVLCSGREHAHHHFYQESNDILGFSEVPFKEFPDASLTDFVYYLFKVIGNSDEMTFDR